MFRSLRVFFASGVLLLACAAHHADEPEVLEALGATIKALQASDFDRLWELTDQETRASLIDLSRRIHAALKQVPEVYGDLGEAQMAAARTALGQPLVDEVFPDDERAGPKLLARLLTPDQMRFDGHAMDGFENNSVTVDTSRTPHRAIVHTSAGERFGFIKTDDGWRSLLVRDLILESGSFRLLADNISKIDEAATSRIERWRQSRDPTTPQGAYNLARTALTETPVNAALLYSLLDDDAREAVLVALKSARDAQREIQRRTTRRQRRKAYEEAGLTLHVDARSDRELYTLWAATDTWQPPLTVTDEPVKVELAPAGDRATVVTASGGRVVLVRDGEGLWRIADQASKLEGIFSAPLQRSQP